MKTPEAGPERSREVRLVAVSNRLPVAIEREGTGWVVRPGARGMVTALLPPLGNRGGVWVGWPGTAEDIDLQGLLDEASRAAGYRLRQVRLTAEEVRDFYHGFANEIIWPLFHGFESRCNFIPEYWRCYLDVNRKFAEAVARESRETDYIWVHDYQIMHVGHALKDLGVERKKGFFLHIPFPPPDVFVKLPWRTQILNGLLAYDLVGFQTMNDRANFLGCLRRFRFPGLRITGRGAVMTVDYGGREIRVGAFPVSIDFQAFAARAGSTSSSERSWYFHEAIPERQIILGLDRLDYTKGIPERLDAFGNALARFPDLRGEVSLVQIVIPSRAGVPEYQQLKARVERIISEINGRFAYPGWIPVHYFYRSLSRDELVAYYRAAEIMLVTPLRDGMNLVSKEYCACNLEGRGTVILSEFAGSAAELNSGALLVNPYDIEGMADAIHQAFTMSPEERRERMRRMRGHLRRRDIFWWVDSVLQAAFARRLEDFPQVEDYAPGALPEPGTGREPA